jgi:hypothetical protein
VAEGLYESKEDDIWTFRDVSNEDFYPLRIEPERLYLGTLKDYDTDQNLK